MRFVNGQTVSLGCRADGDAPHSVADLCVRSDWAGHVSTVRDALRTARHLALAGAAAAGACDTGTDLCGDGDRQGHAHFSHLRVVRTCYMLHVADRCAVLWPEARHKDSINLLPWMDRNCAREQVGRVVDTLLAHDLHHRGGVVGALDLVVGSLESCLLEILTAWEQIIALGKVVVVFS